MFKKNHCSPANDKKTSSCLPNDSLKKLGKLLNKEYKCSIDTNCNDNKLKKQIKDWLNKNSSCNSEVCLIEKIKKKIPNDEYEYYMEHFRPLMPKIWNKKPNTWLNTNDIDNVMFQYEDKYPKFKYLGTQPVDFSVEKNNKCVSNKLCDFDINEYMNKYKSLGMVINTDPHDGDGEHWFSIYFDLVGINRDKPSIYYFDSAKSKPSHEIINFINKIKNDKPDIDFLYNDIQHQYGNTECGIYSLHFLTEMLKGKDFFNYINQKRNDKQMEKYRKKFFIKK